MQKSQILSCHQKKKRANVPRGTCVPHPVVSTGQDGEALSDLPCSSCSLKQGSQSSQTGAH